MTPSSEEFRAHKVTYKSRTYFLEIRGTGTRKRLAIVASRRLADASFERQRIEVPEDCFKEFLEALQNLLAEERRPHNLGARSCEIVDDPPPPVETEKQTLDDIRSLHPRAYMPWSAEDDANLARAYKTCQEISTLANTFQRQSGAIRSRLRKLALLE